MQEKKANSHINYTEENSMYFLDGGNHKNKDKNKTKIQK